MQNVNYGPEKIANAIDCDNSLDNPTNVAPVVNTTTFSGPAFTINAPAQSLTVFRVNG